MAKQLKRYFFAEQQGGNPLLIGVGNDSIDKRCPVQPFFAKADLIELAG